MNLFNEEKAKPFLKWAGGKTQLLNKFVDYFPKELKSGKIENYYEPFLGSGAVFFFVAQRYNIKKAFLSDINEELIITFEVVKRDVEKLIHELKIIKHQYNILNMAEKEELFYIIREQYNKEREQIDFTRYSTDWIYRASQMIFLNKTCFNGLFRLNRKGDFNVPFGKYNNPPIYSEENLYAVSDKLKTTELFVTDFNSIDNLVGNFFVYFDPPYRPLSKTSNFTSYSRFSFTEEDQVKLANLFNKLDKHGCKLMLSNSDPENFNEKDNFFKDLYSSYKISKVKASRMINCKGDKRGPINELIITNYEPTN